MTEHMILPEGQESFKINEVCKLANVQPYMLRFWGQEFSQLKAGKTGTGQRTFQRNQVELILEIKRLLFDEGLTIAGARKRLDNSDPVAKPVVGSKAGDQDSKQKHRSKTQRSPSPDGVKGSSPKQKVDKPPVENVQPFLATLRDVRKELAEVVAELKIK
jgi:DNA-binding transcriptional MerR regulator